MKTLALSLVAAAALGFAAPSAADTAAGRIHMAQAQDSGGMQSGAGEGAASRGGDDSVTVRRSKARRHVYSEPSSTVIRQRKHVRRYGSDEPSSTTAVRRHRRSGGVAVEGDVSHRTSVRERGGSDVNVRSRETTRSMSRTSTRGSASNRGSAGRTGESTSTRSSTRRGGKSSGENTGRSRSGGSSPSGGGGGSEGGGSGGGY